MNQDLRPLRNGSQLVNCNPFCAYQIFYIMILAKLQFGSNNKNDFMLGGGTTQGTVLKIYSIRKVENYF